MSTHEITSKVRELKELKAQIEMLQDEAAAIEDAIKAEMLTKGVDEMQVEYLRLNIKLLLQAVLTANHLKQLIKSFTINTAKLLNTEDLQLHKRKSLT